MDDENLKCVVQHHCTDLIEAFKQNLVYFANEFWSCNVITRAAKDNLLDPSKGGADLRASNLVSSICNTLSPLQNRSEQYEYMKFVLDMLEKAGESPLATSMRTELASMGVDIPPLYANPMPDVRDRQFNTEPVGNEYTVPHMYETQKRKRNESIVPTFQANMQPQTDSASSVVPPTTKVDRKVSFSKSDSVISYHTPYKQEYTNKFPLPETQPHDNEDQHPTSTGNTSRPYSEQCDGPSLNGTQQSLDKLHMQEQKDIYNRLIAKYEQEIKDLRSSLEERNQRLQEKTDLERTEVINSKLIARYEQENKDLRSSLEERDQRLQEKTDLERTEAINSKLIARYEQENKDLRSSLEERDQRLQEKTDLERTEAINSKLIARYEQENKDLRSSLEERDQRLQEKTDLERTEAINSNLIARYEQENKDLKTRLDQLQVRLIETQERQRQRDSLLYHIGIAVIAVIAVFFTFVCYNYFSRR